MCLCFGGFSPLFSIEYGRFVKCFIPLEYLYRFFFERGLISLVLSTAINRALHWMDFEVHIPMEYLTKLPEKQTIFHIIVYKFFCAFQKTFQISYFFTKDPYMNDFSLLLPSIAILVHYGGRNRFLLQNSISTQFKI